MPDAAGNFKGIFIRSELPWCRTTVHGDPGVEGVTEPEWWWSCRCGQSGQKRRDREFVAAEAQLHED
jgi:hypothetical protein